MHLFENKLIYFLTFTVRCYITIMWRADEIDTTIVVGYDTEDNRWFYAMSSPDLKVISYFDDEESAMNGAEILIKEIESLDKEYTVQDITNGLVS